MRDVLAGIVTVALCVLALYVLGAAVLIWAPLRLLGFQRRWP